MSLELLACNTQAAICEAGVLPESSQLICQAALRYLHHVHSVLARDIYRVLYHTHLQGNKQITQTPRWKNNFLSGIFKLCA